MKNDSAQKRGSLGTEMVRIVRENVRFGGSGDLGGGSREQITLRSVGKTLIPIKLLVVRRLNAPPLRLRKPMFLKAISAWNNLQRASLSHQTFMEGLMPEIMPTGVVDMPRQPAALQGIIRRKGIDDNDSWLDDEIFQIREEAEKPWHPADDFSRCE
ncbi:hypothetical protein [Hyphomicrobium sp.]|uniref:hypothetical protein n=1 Tax=Hyphomicrobium sp. TaxID=82 RepID=UPI0025C3056F|nr:hypothetical protein [Hyphomicrobium sp.]MCC7253047.1 hypothetical protein [Hyphomicrobium sp.]